MQRVQFFCFDLFQIKLRLLLLLLLWINTFHCYHLSFCSNYKWIWITFAARNCFIIIISNHNFDTFFFFSLIVRSIKFWMKFHLIRNGFLDVRKFLMCPQKKTPNKYLIIIVQMFKLFNSKHETRKFLL